MADFVLPMAPNPTPTANPDSKNIRFRTHGRKSFFNQDLGERGDEETKSNRQKKYKNEKRKEKKERMA